MRYANGQNQKLVRNVQHLYRSGGFFARTSDKPMLQMTCSTIWNLGADPRPARITIRG
jgi:hypothetical protein